jgi:uncharacterized membrane protein (DUF2068 family)
MVDWNLRGCSRSGHVTYAPDEPELATPLSAGTAFGPAWRCLRCGTFVLGEAKHSGPASEAPVLLRGKALRSAFILRLLAIERFIRAALLIALGLAVLQFKSSQVSLRELFERDLSAAKPLLNQLGWNATDSGLIRSAEHVLNAKGSTLTAVAVFLLGYGALQVVEGVGLWRLERWGEYFAVIATSVFLPLEIYELTERVTVLRVGALVINIAAVVYLLVTKHLFGIRGGRAAYLAERREESLVEVTESATGSATGSDAGGSATAE